MAAATGERDAGAPRPLRSLFLSPRPHFPAHELSGARPASHEMLRKFAARAQDACDGKRGLCLCSVRYLRTPNIIACACRAAIARFYAKLTGLG